MVPTISAEIANLVAEFNSEVKKNITGSTYNSVAHITSDGMILLAYGDKSYTFNPNGYNIVYNKKRLYNNEVVDALIA